MRYRPARTVALAALLGAAALAGCSHKVELYCDEETPCEDPELPFCDLAGEYPASEGIGHTCIPSPFDASVLDAAPGQDGGADAAPGPDATPTPDGIPADANPCGNGDIDPGEDCDDENDINWDGCANDCKFSPGVKQVAAGRYHTCALFHAGNIKCWGSGDRGLLGDGDGTDHNIGDDETAAAAVDVDLGIGVKATQVAVGTLHSCALTSSGKVKCWGTNEETGQLGYPGLDYVGDSPADFPLPDVELGSDYVALQIAVGNAHSCAVLNGGSLKCWGVGAQGRLGSESTANIGYVDGDMPPANVDVGGAVDSVSAGYSHTCALLTSGNVRCWGYGGEGRLGYGDTDTIGDESGEMPPPLGNVNVGGLADLIAANELHTCALIGANVRCWGTGWATGYGAANIGDNTGEMPPADLDLGGTATFIDGGHGFNCALMTGGKVRCWRTNSDGALGYPGTTTLNTMPPADVDIGGYAVGLSVGYAHVCVVLDNGKVRCWGSNDDGQLGYGHTGNVGDNETPASQGDVPVW